VGCAGVQEEKGRREEELDLSKRSLCDLYGCRETPDTSLSIASAEKASRTGTAMLSFLIVEERMHHASWYQAASLCITHHTSRIIHHASGMHRISCIRSRVLGI
jgi:hypothetical protein